MKLKRPFLFQISLMFAMVLIVNISSANAQNTFPASGNVGVGTTSPTTPLEVRGTAGWNGDGNITTLGSSDACRGLRIASRYTGNSLGISAVQSLAASTTCGVLDTPWPLALNPDGGNVGIGTTSPSTRLHIEGGLLAGGVNLDGVSLNYLPNPSGTGRLLIGWNRSAGNGEVNLIANRGAGGVGGFRFSDYNNSNVLTDLMTLNGNGKVGIGTTSPDGILHVSKDLTAFSGGDVGQLILSEATDSSYRLIAGTETSGGYSYIQAMRHGFTWNGTLALQANGGNVGIGTTSPGYKLDVNGEINATGLRINGTPISTGGSQWNNGPNSISYSAGNVGIGTTNPGAKLDVQGAIASNRNWFYLAGAGDTNHAISNVSGDGEQFRYWNFLDFYSPNGGGNVRLLNNGNVGIGTGTPAAKLDVNGSIRGGGYSAGAGNISSYSMEVGGPNPSATNGVATIFFHHHGVVANQLRYTNGTLYWEAAGNGYGTTQPNLVVSGTINAKYQDVAEWVPSTEKLSAGTVVVLDSSKSNQVIASSQSYDTRVAGVISEQPGIALGEKSDNKVLVATTGRVRVKVDATKSPIHIGDLLVTSDIPGVAMRSEAVNIGDVQLHRPGTLIGKALEPLEKGSGEILVLLSLQ